MERKGENIYKRKDCRREARYIKGYAKDTETTKDVKDVKDAKETKNVKYVKYVKGTKDTKNAKNTKNVKDVKDTKNINYGAAQYRYCCGPSYRENKKKAGQAKAALRIFCRLPETVKDQYFADYCEEWIRISRSRVKESTYVKYSSLIEKYIKPQLGQYRIPMLSTALIEKFSWELLSQNHLSVKSVRDILSVVRSILKYAEKQYNGILPQVDVIYPKAFRQELRILSREEQNRFIRYLTNDMDLSKFGILLAMFTGLRIGELCALRWRDFYIEQGLLRVSATLQRLRNVEDGKQQKQQKTKILISEPKSSASVRWIPLSGELIALCRKWQAPDPEAFVLTGRQDRFIEARTLQYRLNRYVNDCNLDQVHFHTLRHTFATRCVEAGFEIKSLSEILGHTDPRFTLNRYVHPSMDLKRAELKKLQPLFENWNLQ